MHYVVVTLVHVEWKFEANLPALAKQSLLECNDGVFSCYIEVKSHWNIDVLKVTALLFL